MYLNEQVYLNEFVAPAERLRSAASQESSSEFAPQSIW